MYNVRLKHFKNGETQARIYSHAIRVGYSRPSSTSEGTDSAETDSEEYFVVEPFTGTLCREIQGELDEEERKRERSMLNSLKRAKQKIYDIARANEWEYFITLTFDPLKVDRYDYEECAKKLRYWLDNTKRRLSPDFRYLIVPERHKDGAFHFHGLISHCEGLQIVSSKHRDQKGNEIYNIGSYGLGFTTATKVKNNTAVTKYITKYTTKDLVENLKGKRKFWASRNCEKPLVQDFLLSREDKVQLHDELIEDAQAFKAVDYEIDMKRRMVCYYESKGLTIARDEEEGD